LVTQSLDMREARMRSERRLARFAHPQSRGNAGLDFSNRFCP
jgi:hypothetical protein